MKNINKISVFIAFFGVLCLSACSKEKGTVTPNVLRKLDKITNSDGNFYTYTYDANGRISRLDTKSSYSIFSYNGSTVTETNVQFSPASSTTFTISLNAQGFATYETYTSGSYNYAYEREFNSNGNVTRIVSKSKSTTSSTFTKDYEFVYTYDSDNDLQTLKFLNGTGTQLSKNDYEYDKNHYNTTGSEFNGLNIFGKSALHFSTKSTYIPSSGAAQITTYSGTFDKKGYLLSSVSTSGSTVTNSTFTYK